MSKINIVNKEDHLPRYKCVAHVIFMYEAKQRSLFRFVIINKITIYQLQRKSNQYIL